MQLSVLPETLALALSYLVSLKRDCVYIYLGAALQQAFNFKVR